LEDILNSLLLSFTVGHMILCQHMKRNLEVEFLIVVLAEVLQLLLLKNAGLF